jgi:hypothetical protein
MIIPITEESMRQYITEIVKTQKYFKTFENLWHKRPFELISEGLIMTYAPHKLVSILNKKYDFSQFNAKVNVFDRTQPSHPINKQNTTNYTVNTTRDYNKLIEIGINFKFGLQNVDKNILSDIIHTCESCGWIFASLQDMYTLKEYKKIEDCDFETKHTYNMYFRPKFDQQVKENGIPNECYHICPTKLVDKILKQGLHPKDYGRISNHPERVYLFLKKPFDWKEVANTFKESRDDNYSLLKIDTSKLYNKMKFYFDSLTMTDNPAIYTNETIPPQYIIEIDREKNEK